MFDLSILLSYVDKLFSSTLKYVKRLTIHVINYTSRAYYSSHLIAVLAMFTNAGLDDKHSLTHTIIKYTRRTRITAHTPAIRRSVSLLSRSLTKVSYERNCGQAFERQLNATR